MEIYAILIISILPLELMISPSPVVKSPCHSFQNHVTALCFHIQCLDVIGFGKWWYTQCMEWKNPARCCINRSGQIIIIFHQPRFPWNKGISLTKPPFGVRSCEVAIIWPDQCFDMNLKLVKFVAVLIPLDLLWLVVEPTPFEKYHWGVNIKNLWVATT